MGSEDPGGGLGHTGICRWEGARIRGVAWPRLGMQSISSSGSGQIPNITSVKGGGCGAPWVGLSHPAMAGAKMFVTEDVQREGERAHPFELMNTMHGRVVTGTE